MNRELSADVEFKKLRTTLNHVLSRVSEAEIELKALRLHVERLEKQIGDEVAPVQQEIERIKTKLKTI
jgi:hypothetical protein